MAEAQQTSDYPGALDTFVTLTDKEDLAEVSDINKIKAAILATQTEIGTDPAGSLTDLTTRLAVALANNGAMQQGTAFPGSPVDGQMFYRTDDNVMYIYNGSTWDAQGQSLSNVVFVCDFYSGGYSVNNYGIRQDTTETPSTPTSLGYISAFNITTNAQTAYATKFKKLAGISTITIYMYVSVAGGRTGTWNASIGGQTGNTTSTSVTRAWINFDVDVSSLTTGTVYDVVLQQKTDLANNAAHTFGAIGIAS